MITLKEIFGLAGKGWVRRMHLQTTEAINQEIYIRDTEISGEQVIALFVNGIAVNYIGYPTKDKDPDGFTLYDNPRHLIEQLIDLRQQEYTKRMTEHGVIREMERTGLTLKDLKKW